MSQLLDGPRCKIRRALDEIHVLRELEKTFTGEANFQLVRAELNLQTGNHAYRIQKQPASPLGLGWGVSIGEIAHNLRSALNNLTWQLALLKDSNPAKSTQFPIFNDYGRAPKTNSPKDVGEGFAGFSPGMIGRLHTSHQSKIEKLQPYRSNDPYESHPLLNLHNINNADKHRVILAVVVNLGMISYGSWGDTDPFIPNVLWEQTQRIVEDGAILFEVPADVVVNPNPHPFVVFGDGCPEVKGRGVCYVLTQIAEHVSGIVDGFLPEFP